MKKFILLFFISQLIWAQDFQIVEAEYFWGQTDPGFGNGTALNAEDGAFDTAVEEIITTYATTQTSYAQTLFNIRVKDADGLWGATFKKVIFVGDAASTSQNLEITEFEYFFGNFDPGEGNGNPIVAFDGALDSAVEEVFRNQTTWDVTNGPILFNIRAKDADGLWGPLFKKTVFPFGANPNAQLIAEGDSIEICPGSSVTLTYNGPFGFTPTWFDGSQEETITFTPTEEGSYSCTASLDDVTYSDSIDITFKPEPEAAIEPSGTILICASSSFTLQANTGTGLSYQWFLDGNIIEDATNSSYLPTALGSYTVEITNSTTECSKLSEPTILSNSFSIEPTGIIDFCSQQELSVPFGSSNTYQWQKNSVDIPNANSNTFLATESGDYSCIITNQSCTYQTTAVELNNDSPSPTGSNNQIFCNSPNTSDIQVTGTNIQWYDSETGGNLIDPNTNLSDGQIVYASQTVNGCESSDRLEVAISLQDTEPPVIDALDQIQLDLIQGSVTLSPSMIELGSTDNCEISAQNLSQTEFDCDDFELTSPIIITYTVEDSSGNSSSTNITVNLTDSQSSCNLSLNELNKINISVYPVPTKNLLNIETGGVLEIDEVKIFDIRGRLVKEVKPTSSFKKIDLRDLQAASYFIKIRSKAKQIFVKQIIIKK